MPNEYELINGKFQHVILEGSSYDVGKQQGELIKKVPDWVNFVSSTNLDLNKMGFKNFKELQHFFNEYCPGINDEIQGLADVLKIPIEKLSFTALATYLKVSLNVAK